MTSTLLRSGVLSFALVALASADARADIFAALCVPAPAPRADMDIAVLNATLGTRVTLPAAVNTTADEIHPSISTDGRRLAFQRIDAAAGVLRVIVVDLSTAQSADLFTGFEMAVHPEFDPAITPDGGLVITGGLINTLESFPAVIPLTLSELDSFPLPPFTHDTVHVGSSYFGGNVSDVAAGGGKLLAFRTTDGLVLSQFFESGFGYAVRFCPTIHDAGLGNPAIAANNPQVVLFDARRTDSTNGSIMFRPASLCDFAGVPIALPAVVNSPDDESQPAVTADGRYVAFVRHSLNDSHDRLFVWDSQTQTLLNANGVDLGVVDTRNRGGAVSLYTKSLLLNSTISTSGIVSGGLTLRSGVGILVQRIVGTTTILNEKAYEVEPVGRVPLGEFESGTFHTQWDLTVNGQPLEPGRYLVTVRAVEGTIARELGRPRLLVIPDRQ